MNATSATLIDLLAAAEAREPVRDWRVGGIRVWTMLRIRWFFAIWSEQYCAEAPARGRALRMLKHAASVLGARVRCAFARLRDRSGEAALDRTCDALFFSDGVSFVNVGGRHYDRFCDPLIELLQARGLRCTLLTAGHRFLTPRHTPSHFVQPALDFAHLRGAPLGRKLAATVELPGIAPVRDTLAKVGVDHPSLDPRRMAVDVGRVIEVSRTLGRLLDQLKPKLAFVVSFYNLDGMALALACRERRIPLVDIQHGVQGELHPAYGRLPPVPAEGYELVPSRFWVWSDEEAQAIAQWAGGGRQHSALIGGNVWLDRWLAGEGQMARDADTQVRALCGRASGKRVLVTLQWGLSEAEQLAPLMELIGTSGEEFVFWIRLHPVMLPERATIEARFAQFPRARVVVAEATDLPLYALLRHADVHLTHSSSTVIEAQLFGVRSVVMSRYGAEIYPRQIADGVARLVEGGASALHAALLEQAAGRGPVVAPADRAGPALDQLLGEAGIGDRAA